MDPNNAPHVGEFRDGIYFIVISSKASVDLTYPTLLSCVAGGNTWAGGTGGRDTAGLGGKGGPYRLDAGHAVHQLSQAEKDNVPEHVKAAARQQLHTTGYYFLMFWLAFYPLCILMFWTGHGYFLSLDNILVHFGRCVIFLIAFFPNTETNVLVLLGSMQRCSLLSYFTLHPLSYSHTD
jgi:hypothetical protein